MYPQGSAISESVERFTTLAEPLTQEAVTGKPALYLAKRGNLFHSPKYLRKIQKMGFSVKLQCLFLSYEVIKEFWREKMWNRKSWDFPSNRNILFRFYEVSEEFWREKLSYSKSWDFPSNHYVCLDYMKLLKNFDEKSFVSIRYVVILLRRKPLFWKGKNAYSKMSEDTISLTLSPMV